MSAEDKIGTTPSIPEWEAELWSYVGHGDGMHCPLRGRCLAVQNGEWCPDEGRERLNQLFDGESFNARDYDFVKAEGDIQCRVIILLERLAQKYLRNGNVICPPVSEQLVKLFDQKHSIEIHQLPLKAYRGAIWYHKDGWIIQVKESDTIPTKRFTILHEAFHILAHSKTTPVFSKRGSIGGSFNEWMADSFAAYTLVPRKWLAEKWAEVKDLDKMAKIFAVPKTVVYLRLRQLDLV